MSYDVNTTYMVETHTTPERYDDQLNPMPVCTLYEVPDDAPCETHGNIYLADISWHGATNADQFFGPLYYKITAEERAEIIPEIERANSRDWFANEDIISPIERILRVIDGPDTLAMRGTEIPRTPRIPDEE